MGVAIPRRTSELSRAVDFKAEILDALGSLDDISVMYNMALLGTYIRPERTRGGIIRPDENIHEDLYQGKVGLVLKLGPMAFQDDDVTKFYGQKAEPGEWVVYRVGDAWSLTVRGIACRLVADSQIKMKLSDPEAVL